MAFQGHEIRQQCVSAQKNSMSAPRACDLRPKGPNGAKDGRHFDGRSFTANLKLRLMRVCDEVSMRSCFLLTAVIATQQEQLPSLLVDPTCILKLAWCAHMEVKFEWYVAFVLWLPPLWESREHLSCTWSKCHMFFSDFSSPKLPHGVVMSLDLQRAEHRVERLVAAAMDHLAMSSCLLTRDAASTLHDM